jgi:hypothetical protein
MTPVKTEGFVTNANPDESLFKLFHRVLKTYLTFGGALLPGKIACAIRQLPSSSLILSTLGKN